MHFILFYSILFYFIYFFIYLFIYQHIYTFCGVGSTVVTPTTVVRNLDVMLDAELSMREHVSRTAQSCFYHLGRLRSVCRQLGRDVTARLVSAFVSSRLDYCNVVLTGLPTSTLSPLQRVFNAAARLVVDLRPRDHVS